MKRTLMFTKPAYLYTKNDQLFIKLKSEDLERSVPLEDLGFIIIESLQITMSAQLITKALEQNIALFYCNEKHMPIGYSLSNSGHSEATLRVSKQINSSVPLKKQLWQQIITSKVANQAKALKHLEKKPASSKLQRYSRMVRSGDMDNIEARAAAHYWKSFTDQGAFFSRDYDGSDKINARLNYGYAILRGAVARALVGSGLLLVYGLNHRNKYNPYVLADDVMEPYRPYIDLEVSLIGEFMEEEQPLSPKVKRKLVEILTHDVVIDGCVSPMITAISKTTASLAQCFLGERRQLSLPVL